MIYMGADHRGYGLKEALKVHFEGIGVEARDMGAMHMDISDDYPVFARAAIEALILHPGSQAILICGSGHGMDMIANKYKGVRSALCFNTAVAKQSREHEDANVLVLPSDWLKEREAFDIVNAWLEASFGGADRNIRRLQAMKETEESNFK